MDPQAAQPLYALLLVVMVGCVAQLLLPDAGDKPEGQRQPRDLDREHALGGHRETPAWGCRRCGR